MAYVGVVMNFASRAWTSRRSASKGCASSPTLPRAARTARREAVCTSPLGLDTATRRGCVNVSEESRGSTALLPRGARYLQDGAPVTCSGSWVEGEWHPAQRGAALEMTRRLEAWLSDAQPCRARQSWASRRTANSSRLARASRAVEQSPPQECFRALSSWRSMATKRAHPMSPPRVRAARLARRESASAPQQWHERAGRCRAVHRGCAHAPHGEPSCDWRAWIASALGTAMVLGMLGRCVSAWLNRRAAAALRKWHEQYGSDRETRSASLAPWQAATIARSIGILRAVRQPPNQEGSRARLTWLWTVTRRAFYLSIPRARVACLARRKAVCSLRPWHDRVTQPVKQRHAVVHMAHGDVSVRMTDAQRCHGRQNRVPWPVAMSSRLARAPQAVRQMPQRV